MKTFDYPLSGALHTVVVTTTDKCLISWNGDPVAIASGRYKFNVKGDGNLSIDYPGKDKPNFNVTTKGLTKEEQLDDRPLPAPPEPSNMLAMLRAKVRHEMGVTREAFGDIYSPYETDVEMFEEDFPTESSEISTEASTVDKTEEVPVTDSGGTD